MRGLYVALGVLLVGCVLYAVPGAFASAPGTAAQATFVVQ
jgi:hypothetical protein